VDRGLWTVDVDRELLIREGILSRKIKQEKNRCLIVVIRHPRLSFHKYGATFRQFEWFLA
jgi:hypothetical protein